MKSKRKRSAPLNPNVPTHVNYLYVASSVASFVFKGYPLLHGALSVLPHFMLLQVLKNRLVTNDLASVLILAGFLSEAFSHFFHQFAHDDNLFIIFFFQHVMCSLFFAMANISYYFERKRYAQSYREIIPQVFGTLPILQAAYFLLQYLFALQEQSMVMKYGQCAQVVFMAFMMVFAIWRKNTTSNTSFFYGLGAAILYCISDLLYFSIKNMSSFDTFSFQLFFKICHKSGLFLQMHSSINHILFMGGRRQSKRD